MIDSSHLSGLIILEAEGPSRWNYLQNIGVCNYPI